jgi:hypothetical protein
VVDSQWIIHQVIPSLGSQVFYSDETYFEVNSFGTLQSKPPTA